MTEFTFTIRSGALPSTARLAGFHGVEGFSRLYQFEVILVMTEDVGHDFDVKSAVGAKATISIEPSDGAPYVINGIFATMELVIDFAKRTVFRAVLVPHFWHLTQSSHSRMFTQQTIPAILEAVLQKGGAGSFSLQLTGSYSTEEHVCQYHESDFDFVSRWMERLGMYYYFEQGEDEERLIITDDRASHTPLGGKPVRYYPQIEDAYAGDRFRAFHCRATSLPASVRFKDYDYTKPSFPVAGQAPVSPSGVGEISVHGARFFTPDDGAKLAKVKAESLLAGQVVYHASGAALYLRPGYTFELEDHPRAAFNTRYLTTEMEHWVNALPGVPELAQIITWHDGYRLELSAIASDVQYRAPQRTAWPRIYGGEHAVIDGASVSDYAQIDSHGRYAVKFHFDESDLTGGKASTWVRMLQPHGGGIEGFHFPLRVGTEVVCTFSGGDPDRPAIVGVAPNALTPSPVTSGNNTRNVIQTGGRNRLEIEDLAGQQRVTLSTPHSNTYHRMGAPNDDHTQILSTDGSTLLHSGTNLDIETLGNKTDTVTGTVTETYKNTKSETVTGKVTEKYEADFDQTITGNRTTMLDGDATDEIMGNETRTIHGVGVKDFEQDYTLTVKGAYVTDVHRDNNTTTRGNLNNTIIGSSKTTVDGSLISVVNGDRTQTTQGSNFSHTFGVYTTVAEVLRINNILGGSITAVEGGAVNAVVGGRVNLTWPFHINLNVGMIFSALRGLNFAYITGGKYEEIEGFKLEVVTGVNLKNTTVEGLNTDIHLQANRVKLTQEQARLATRAIEISDNDLTVTL